MTENLPLIFPANKGSSGNALITDGNGNLSWATVATSATSVDGDLSGTISSATIKNAAITSAKILDGTISDNDISPTANIDQTKIKDLTTDLGNKQDAFTTTAPVNYNSGTKVLSLAPGAGNTLLGVNAVGSGMEYKAIGANAPLVLSHGAGTINLDLDTVPVTKGGTGLSSFTADRAYIANGTGSALVPFSCASTDVFGFSALGKPTCTPFSAINGTFFNQNGNSFGVAATLGTNDAQKLQFETNGVTRMTLTSTGNLGIGVANPAEKLVVSGNGSFWGKLEADYNGAQDAFHAHQEGSGNIASFSQGPGWDEKVVINNAGDVGIGMSPNGKLSVEGNTLIEDGELSIENYNAGVAGRLNIHGQDNGYNYGMQFLYSDDWNKYWGLGHRSLLSERNNFIIEEHDGTNYNTRVAIKPGGNVGIGTSSPAEKLDVQGNVKIGNSGNNTCNATNEGSMRYNSVSKSMEFCNGTAWNPFAKSSEIPKITSAQYVTGTVACNNYLTPMTFTGNAGQKVEITVTHTGRPTVTASGGHFYNRLYLNGVLVDSGGGFTHTTWIGQAVTNYSGTLATSGTHTVRAYLDCGNGTTHISDSYPTEWPNGGLHYRVIVH